MSLLCLGKPQKSFFSCLAQNNVAANLEWGGGGGYGLSGRTTKKRIFLRLPLQKKHNNNI